MRNVEVDLGPRSYSVFVGAGLLKDLNDLIPEMPLAGGCVVIADRNTERLYGEAVEGSLSSRGPVHRIEIDPGETSKSFAAAAGILEELASKKLRRDDLLVTLGGGMVGDLGGFVASVYQRGIPLVHLPTSLLAQVDAAVGGKTAVNLPAGKNLAGTFHQPSAVVADVSTLETLPEEEFRSGLAEVVKYGLTLAPGILGVLEGSRDAVLARDAGVMEELVTECVEVKARLVSADEHDHGDRVLLNYGHTLGHALEAAHGYGKWLHGEAVSVGMVFAAALAGELGLLDEASIARHESILESFGLPIRGVFDPDEMIAAMSIDKKYRGGQRWVLLKGIGEAVVESGVDERAVRKALGRVRTQ